MLLQCFEYFLGILDTKYRKYRKYNINTGGTIVKFLRATCAIMLFIFPQGFSSNYFNDDTQSSSS